MDFVYLLVEILVGMAISVSSWISSFSTAFTTVITGSIVFALGHLIVKLGVNPVQEMSELRGEIAGDLTYYANVTTSPDAADGQKRIEVGQTYREKASLLSAKAHKVPFYRFWSFCNLVPDEKDVLEARSELIGLSNNVQLNNGRGNYKKIEDVKSCLNLDFSE